MKRGTEGWTDVTRREREREKKENENDKGTKDLRTQFSNERLFEERGFVSHQMETWVTEPQDERRWGDEQSKGGDWFERDELDRRRALKIESQELGAQRANRKDSEKPSSRSPSTELHHFVSKTSTWGGSQTTLEPLRTTMKHTRAIWNYRRTTWNNLEPSEITTEPLLKKKT